PVHYELPAPYPNTIFKETLRSQRTTKPSELNWIKMASFSLHIQPINTTQLPSSLSLQKFSCFFISSTPFFSSKPIFSQSNTRKWSNHKDTCSVSSSVEECNNEDGSEYKVLTAIRSSFNDIVILETADSRMLLLDATHNVHSIFNKGNKWTGSYWDQFVSLPPIVPKGPIAIFGLGGGTAAHLLLEVWPMLQLDGWEIDEILVYKARDYLGLADLENQTEAGGRLNVIVGDALSSSATIPGGYAGKLRKFYYYKICNYNIISFFIKV
ncbi:hypothetical protein Leryth_001380, partial [Lithospermum erythrorhizon]